MRIALTGSSGRVGRVLGRWLAAHGHQVVGLDRVAAAGTTWVAEVDDPAAIARLLDGAQALVHAAALHAPHVGQVADAEFDRVNVQATARLLDACLQRGIHRLVFTSSTAVYGDAATPPGRAGWVDEHLQPAPRTVYHRSKLAAERLVQQAALAEPRLRAWVLRIARCFPEPADQMAVYRLHRGIDLRDVAAAHAWALAQPAAGAHTAIVASATPFGPDDAEQLAHDAPAVIRQRAPALARAMAQRGWPLPQCIDRVYVGARLAAAGWQAQHGADAALAAWDAGSPELLPPRSDLPRCIQPGP